MSTSNNTEYERTDTPLIFRIQHTGGEWPGTFQRAVDATISDLLLDGPIPVTVVVAGEDSYTYRRDCVVVRIDENWLYVGQGEPVDRGELLAVEIP